MPHWSRGLLRAVGHEIRAPLTVIRANSTLVLEERRRLSRAEISDLMRQIDSSARLVDVIVGDLEALAKQSRVRLRIEDFDLVSLLASFAPDLRALVPARHLELALPDHPLRLRADAMRLKQVLNNLVENADKYSRQGGSIRIAAEPALDSALLIVEDEGPGVPGDELERIFQPFFRGSRSAGTKGSGLGLAICRALIEAQGGSLSACKASGGRFQVRAALPRAS
ncbi:MAG TPA: ATP-binding protein [Dehalococcoidia bacterium]|nr:ATP-binding protein [Dehalococcoidia bacterium]